MPINRFAIVAGSVFALGALAGCNTPQPATMQARTVDLVAALSPAKEVPPRTGNGQGFAWVSYNESAGTVSWKIYYTGLSGPATAAHFHGPSEKTANAGVAINLVASGPPANPLVGSATITAAQAADLTAGRYYINIHTQAAPGGEIRGQVGTDPW